MGRAQRTEPLAAPVTRLHSQAGALSADRSGDHGRLALAKLNADNRTHAVVLAYETGVLATG
ncbi:hypothetical protein [Streptomyces litchfieldiae]|uniref:Uncharacterized protein n=1 Tax=Streptomyces litchfieldiae TaxID=3075543 RepID=A0ABU2MPS0_9ACTN|nr:hypothetical protein [Streptomyces sp. DSM 44938]MDT0343626.1 hypothetical protein [Streptomyces sp. DSM 44938]